MRIIKMTNETNNVYRVMLQSIYLYNRDLHDRLSDVENGLIVVGILSILLFFAVVFLAFLVYREGPSLIHNSK